MKAYVLDERGQNLVDENHNRRYVHIQPCRGCQEHRWDEDECTEIKKAVKLISLLSDFGESVWYEETGMGSTQRPECVGLNELAEPLRQPFEYDSDEIRTLLGVSQLAAFIGASDTQLKPLTTAHNKIRHLIRHIHNNHRDESNRPLASFNYFELEYPDWFNPESLVELLQNIRSKSHEEIKTYCQRELDRAKSISSEEL